MRVPLQKRQIDGLTRHKERLEQQYRAEQDKGSAAERARFQLETQLQSVQKEKEGALNELRSVQDALASEKAKADKAEDAARRAENMSRMHGDGAINANELMAERKQMQKIREDFQREKREKADARRKLVVLGEDLDQTKKDLQRVRDERERYKQLADDASLRHHNANLELSRKDADIARVSGPIWQFMYSLDF